MSIKHSTQQRFLEITLVIISVSLTCLLFKVQGYRMIVLNLFYLPVILAAFFLGRYRAGVLAVLCMISAAIVTAMDLNNFGAFNSPLVVGLALTIWATVLGLTALLAGTLSDERTQKIEELHDAYVGVVEVLSRYLGSVDPTIKGKATRVAEISQQVAKNMKLSNKEIDDIRVAALLQGLGNIQVTARVIRKAMGDLSESGRSNISEHTFHGSELVQSLGSVLTGALPLLYDHGSYLELTEGDSELIPPVETATGGKIIFAVKRYVALLSDKTGFDNSQKAIKIMKNEDDYHPAVMHALEQIALKSQPSGKESGEDSHAEPAAAI